MADYPTTATSFTDALLAFTSIGFEANAAYAMQGLAAATAHTGDPTKAAHLLGAAAAILTRTGNTNTAFTPIAAQAESLARTALGDDEFERTFSAGLSDHALTP
ncbi:hypothetical protein ACFQV2_13620 [Actinokineospora soli]|uniref:Excreted virulence factor EspC, type VII ESX diderm n=1 Tax=Actinokineospora soli TaxID=1048753 RepID=A0ABW2TKX3_9PSEU